MKRRTFLASVAALTAFPAVARETRSFGGSAFGSYWRLTLADSTTSGTSIVNSIVAEIDALMSPYRVSDLSVFNATRSTDVLPLAPEVLEVAQSALSIAAETEGAFDPTVGPLVGQLGFGPIRGEAGSFRELEVSGTGLRKAAQRLTLDLCGIAKGHALDRIVAALEAEGNANFLIDLGGEVSARGRHPDGRSWRIGVEGAGSIAAIATLGGDAAATSGDAVQGYRLGGRRYGHIISPISDGGLASVTVFHASARRADALATALFAMGRDRAEEFARQRQIEAVLVPDAGAPILTGGVGARILEHA